jgi:hypothetical protein
MLLICSNLASEKKGKLWTTYLVESASQAKVENPRNKICVVVIDISKAFDKVWHNSLIFKLHKLNFPKKLG